MQIIIYDTQLTARRGHKFIAVRGEQFTVNGSASMLDIYYRCRI
jgi:hypothetical protein